MEKSSKLFILSKFARTKPKWRKKRRESGKKRTVDSWFPSGSIIEPNEQKGIGASRRVSRVLVSLLETGSILRDVLPETVDAALWPVDRANDRRKILFFFPFSPYFFLLLLLSFLFFSASLDLLQALESVLASNSRLEYLGERGSVYISFPFVTSFDSLIQYRFSIASQRIFLEGRRIRNSLFSRWKICLSHLARLPRIVTPMFSRIFAGFETSSSLPFKIISLKGTDLFIFELIDLSPPLPTFADFYISSDKQTRNILKKKKIFHKLLFDTFPKSI